jgi:hypothetical protein
MVQHPCAFRWRVQLNWPCKSAHEQYNPSDSALIEEIPVFLLCLSVSLSWWSLSVIEGGRYSRYFVEESAYVQS